MSSFRLSDNTKFAAITVGTIGLFIGVGYLTQPLASRYFQYQGMRFARLGQQQTDTLQALSYFYLAYASDINNPRYRTAIADTYVQRGDISQAAESLGPTPDERLRKAELQLQLGRIKEGLQTLQPLSDAQANVMRSRLYLEDGRVEDAITTVSEPHTASERMQYVLSSAIDNKSAQAASVAATAPIEERTRLQQALSGDLSLAQALYSAHLYRTAYTVASKLPESASKYLLLGSLETARAHGSKPGLRVARETYEKGLGVDPSNIELRQHLVIVLEQIGDKEAMLVQQQKIERLRSGNL